MGVYIKGMEMPKAPNDCPFCDYEEGMCLAWLKVRGDDCIRNCYKYPDMGKRFPDFCPLIEVPDHGRLIDADNLKKSHCVECTLYPDRCLGENCDWGSIYHLEHAKTVIPEDRRDGE